MLLSSVVVLLTKGGLFMSWLVIELQATWLQSFFSYWDGREMALPKILTNHNLMYVFNFPFAGMCYDAKYNHNFKN